MGLLRLFAGATAVLFAVLGGIYAALLILPNFSGGGFMWAFSLRMPANVLLSIGLILYAATLSSACERGAAPARMEESAVLLVIGTVFLLVSIGLRTVFYGVPGTGPNAPRLLSYDSPLHGLILLVLSGLNLIFDLTLAFFIWNAASVYDAFARRAAQIALPVALISLLAGLYEMLGTFANRVVGADRSSTLIPWPPSEVWIGLAMALSAAASVLFAGFAMREHDPRIGT